MVYGAAGQELSMRSPWSECSMGHHMRVHQNVVIKPGRCTEWSAEELCCMTGD